MRNLLLLIPAGLLLTSCVGRPPADASGAEIYEQVCSNCHASDLSGGIGPSIDAGSNTAMQDDAFLELTITRGRGRMPSFQSTLSEEQVERLITYIRDRQR
ncbi:MAG TPA: cytochrome c [Acidimicrobiia bacterium]|nr:cytochrome c [Acidimicrobiia bacterium]